jgi:membrane protease YdiL (CAAX protease family)
VTVESSQTALAPLVPAPPSEPTRGASDWPWWTAPAALVAGLLLAAIAGLVVDIPAALLGVSITASHLPGWLELVDTVVQDIAFVGAAVLFAHVGGRAVSAWQFGLRPPRLRWRSVALLIVALLVGFILLSAIWAEILDVHTKEKVLEQLGAGEGTPLLLLSAALTCVMAPICEELLFRGFIYTALCSWRGPWPAAILTGLVFGGVHAGSAPAVDLVPLAGLGFGLCLLYRRTGSLYPCIAAHSLNNSLAFGALEGWGWQTLVLMVAAPALIALLVLACKRAGVITPPPVLPVGAVTAAAA